MDKICTHNTNTHTHTHTHTHTQAHTVVNSVRTATDILNRRDTLGGRGVGEHHLTVGVANAPQIGHHCAARLVEHLHLLVHLTIVQRIRGLKSQLNSHCIQYRISHVE